MKKMYKASLLLMLFFFAASIVGVMAQPSRGGTPPSFQTSLADETQPFIVSPPNVQALKAEDAQSTYYAPRVAVVLPVDLNPENSGEWLTLETGETIWRLAIEVKGANALLLNYSNFNLPKGSKLFIYNREKTHVLGAYTEENNPKTTTQFSTELVAGDYVVLEYVAPTTMSTKGMDKFDPKTGEVILGKQPKLEMPAIQIDGIGYAYNDFITVTNIYNSAKTPSDLGASGACMININCTQGATWQNQKKGVAATMQKIGSAYYLCSGSVVNNTRGDLTPYFLMAAHCASNSDNVHCSAADFNSWQFYFHWERAACANTSAPVTYRTITGCQSMYENIHTGGADGLLLKFNAAIPASYDIYYNGWDATLVNTWAAGCVGIHHPKGDVKKISTTSANTTTTTGNISGMGLSATDADWTCSFNPTATEGGSSGSPLFNPAGRIIGTLTGGSSSCTAPTGSNIYGKFGYHFDKFATGTGMKTWLDPDNTGVRVLDGRYAGTDPVANFSVSTQTPYAMQPVQFYSQSFNATSYAWQFPGGTPATSTDANPIVTYMVPGGPHNVTLTINGGASTKTEANYILVSEKTNDVEIEIGTGTTTAQHPIGYASGSGLVHTATLYTAAQLGAAGVIKSISWNCNNARTEPRDYIRVWMQHTTATDVAGTPTWNRGVAPNATATLVAEYNAIANVAGWNTFNFNKAFFNYNGTQNVIVFVEAYGTRNASITVNVSPNTRYTATGTNTNITWTAAYNANPTGAGTNNNQVPNIRILKGMPSVVPVANFDGPKKFQDSHSTFREGFESTTFPPNTPGYGLWTMTNTNANQAWRRGNPSGGPAFSTIDPTSTASAVSPYANASATDNRLTSPAITLTPQTNVCQFYGYWEENYNDGTHLEFRVSTNGGSTWTSLWSMPTVPTGRGFEWTKIVVDMTAYTNQTVNFQFWVTGADGYHLAVDGVSLGMFDPLGKYEMYKDDILKLKDLSTGPPVVWDWQFPNSNTPLVQSFGPVPVVTYPFAGIFDLGLTVTNLKGSNTKYMPEQLIVKDRMPIANYKAKGGYDAMYEWIDDDFHPYIPPGFSVAYTNTSTQLPDSYVWNFAGGNPASATTKDAIVKYNNVGDYTTSLKAKNTAGEQTFTREDLVWVGYTTEDITNFNIDNVGLYTGQFQTNVYMLGPNTYWGQAGERYEKPVIPGRISGITAYVYIRGTSTTKLYTMSIRKPNAAGVPDMTAAGQLWSIQYTPASFPATQVPGMFYWAIDPPVAVSDAFFIIIDGFVANSNANNLDFVVGMGDEREADAEGDASLWVNYTAGGGWQPINNIFSDNPLVAGALWPEFTYTQLDVDPLQLTFAPAGTPAQKVNVTANVTYTRTTAESWINITDVAGGFDVTCTNNATGSPRSGSITVSGGGATKIVTVLQGSAPLALNVTPPTQTVPYTGGSADFTITSNVLWTVTCPELWVTITNPTGTNNGTLTVSAALNLSLASRSAIITIKGGGFTRTVTLEQDGAPAYLEIVPNGTINVAKMNGSRDIQVTTNMNWTATANQPWIIFTQNAGAGDGYVYFNFNANPNATTRTAIITVKAGALQQTLTVIQEAGDGTFIVNPNTLVLTSAGSNQNISVTSLSAWTAVKPAGDTWYQLNKYTDGAGTTSVTITYDPNPGAVVRSSQVTFANASTYRYLDIIQKGSATVSWNSPITGGTLTVTNMATGLTISNGASLDLDTEIKVAAAASTGYNLQTLTVNGAPFTSGGTFILTANTTIFVQFQPIVNTLFWNPAPGSSPEASRPVTYGQQIGNPTPIPVPTRTGYTYTGWVIGATSISNTFVWNYTTNQTATTSWTANTYTITFNAQGGTVTPGTMPVTYDQAVGTMPTPTRTGYTFGGWFTAINCGGTQVTAATIWTTTSNLTLYACWTANTYTVVYDGNGATGGATASSTHTYDVPKALTLNGFTRTGHSFAGWATSAAGAVVYADGATVNNLATGGNYTLYAKWTPATYTLTFNPSTGTTTLPSKTVTYNSPIGTPFPNATQPCCNFAGWFIDGTQVFSTTVWTWDGNKEAMARFNYPIEVNITGTTYGKVTTPSGIMTTNSQTLPYALGANANYLFSPNPGAYIANVKITDCSGALVAEFNGTSGVTADWNYDFIGMNKYYKVEVRFAPNCYAKNVIVGTGAQVVMTIPPSTTPVNCIPHGAAALFTFTSSSCADITDILIEGIGSYSGSTFSIPSVTGPLPLIEVQTNAQMFDIVSSVNDPAMGSINPDGTVQYGCAATPTYTITKNLGHKLTGVYIDGILNPAATATGTYTFPPLVANHTIEAVFVPIPTYIIQFGPDAAQNAGGVVYPEDDPTALYYIQRDSASSVKFLIIPDVGYVIDKVMVDGFNNALAVQNGYHLFDGINKNHTITATFKKIKFTINATTTSGGSINPAGAVQVGYGDDQPFTIAPNAGYHIVEVLVDGVFDQDATDFGYYKFFDVQANHSIHAVFAINTYTITPSAGANGTINPDMPVTVNHGANKKFDFIPNTGYQVAQVLVDGAPVAITNNSYTFYSISSDHTIEVTFAKQVYTIVSGNGPNGTIEPLGVNTVEYWEHSEIYTFNPDPGYHIKEVLVDGVNDPLAVFNSEHRFLNVCANHNIYVFFAKDEFTILATATEGGSINPAGSVIVPYGADRQFFFSPDAGYKLSKVIVDGINDEIAVATGTFIFSDVSDDHIISAQFERIGYVVTLPTPASLVGAQIILTQGSQTIVNYNGKFTFEVVLSEGYTQSSIVVRSNGTVVPLIGNEYVINNITADQTVTIEGLKKNVYQIEAKAGVGGDITPKGTFAVEYGDSYKFDITPAFKYLIDDVKINGESYGPLATYTFENVKANATITALFKYDPITTGVPENEAGIKVFSNYNVVTLVNEALIAVKQVEIMDMYGRLVWTGQATGAETRIVLDVAAGIYAVRVITEANDISTTKVSIIK